MNYLYLIGNGFDVNLKIRTDYQSFYDYYLAQVSTDNAVKMVKDDMEKNCYEQWSDLERADSTCIILYYAYDNNNYIHDADIFNHQSELRYELLAKLGLKDITNAANRVFVAYKSRMFDLKG